MKDVLNGIPQVMAIVRVSGNGKVSLKKEVRDYLGTGNEALYLNEQNEILLTTRESASGNSAQVQGNRLCLPEEVVAKLGLEKGSSVAMIQREKAVALKKDGHCCEMG